MADIIDMTDRLPHGAHYVVCMSCAHDWAAVVPSRASWPLECGQCGKMKGEQVNFSDVDWFKRFMSGRNKQKRTLVLLNAKRMAWEKPE